MIQRNSSYYDIMSLGLGGAVDFQEFVDVMLAEKYNAPQTEGFMWDDNIQIDFSYEQLEAELGIYAMATFVDISSPGGTHANSTASISKGQIPRFKHGFTMDEKTIREQMILAQRFGSVTPAMQEQLAKILFNSTDKLIGGNYNTLTYMRHQAVSTGQFAITATNNPGGIANLTFDFGVPAANKKKAGGFGSTGTKYAWSDTTNSNPIGDLMDMVKFAKDNRIPVGNFEMSDALYTSFLFHPKVKEKVALFLNANANISNLSNMLIGETALKAFMSELRLPAITVIDSLVQVDKYNAATRAVEYTDIRPFDEAVVVLRPAGQLGTIKAVEPIVLQDPAARIALFDGGRTVLTQTFDSKNRIQYIESELTALVVPNTSRYILQLTTDEAAS
jgi:hypothetical protein